MAFLLHSFDLRLGSELYAGATDVPEAYRKFFLRSYLPMRDGLPKFKDFPAEFGGSGEQIAE
jgi:hypothetical protein